MINKNSLFYHVNCMTSVCPHPYVIRIFHDHQDDIVEHTNDLVAPTRDNEGNVLYLKRDM